VRAKGKIAIVGSGLIGRAWATQFAGSGFAVALFDPAAGVAKAARSFVRKSLKELEELGLVEDARVASERVRVAKSLADALADAELVQESGPEVEDVKRSAFAEMDAIAAPKTILASSTSFIVASRFSAGLNGKSRCLVAHPVNPPHLVPIVEIAPAPWTDPAVTERARRIYETAGQVPIVLKKESPGFVLNRLQAVLLAEAFRIVGDGICTPEDLDKTMKDGLGLRWSFLGPFETMELNAPGGLPDYCARYGKALGAMAEQGSGGDPFGKKNVARVLAGWTAPHSEERVHRLTQWRDRRLALLKAHKRQAKKKPG
jgi:3-hydroxyacyl-CoA dehydrogenase